MGVVGWTYKYDILGSFFVNVVMELDCLYPMPDWLIVTVVDQTGEANLIVVVQ